MTTIHLINTTDETADIHYNSFIRPLYSTNVDGKHLSEEMQGYILSIVKLFNDNLFQSLEIPMHLAKISEVQFGESATFDVVRTTDPVMRDMLNKLVSRMGVTLGSGSGFGDVFIAESTCQPKGIVKGGVTSLIYLKTIFTFHVRNVGMYPHSVKLVAKFADVYEKTQVRLAVVDLDNEGNAEITMKAPIPIDTTNRRYTISKLIDMTEEVLRDGCTQSPEDVAETVAPEGHGKGLFDYLERQQPGMVAGGLPDAPRSDSFPTYFYFLKQAKNGRIKVYEVGCYSNGTVLSPTKVATFEDAQVGLDYAVWKNSQTRK